MKPGADLPPLVLRCRPAWCLPFGGAALILFALGATTLAGALHADIPVWTGLGAAIVLLAFGAGCAQFFLRHGLSHLALDERGFRLRGPLRATVEIAWTAVEEWDHARAPIVPPALRIVHGPGRRRILIPMIYENSHLLEVGLLQKRFPEW